MISYLSLNLKEGLGGAGEGVSAQHGKASDYLSIAACYLDPCYAPLDLPTIAVRTARGTGSGRLALCVLGVCVCETTTSLSFFCPCKMGQ